MKKTLILGLVALISTASFAAVVKTRDADTGCTLYKVVPADDNGKVKVKAGEVVVSIKDAYGLSFQDMEINFDSREVLVQPTINIVLGLNRPLIGKKAIISADNKDFTYLINQLNRKVNLFEKVCITSDNKIAYAKMFEQQAQ
jgi:hypothetical protein